MAGNPGKKPLVELRRPPPNADSFVNQGAAVPPVYASFPVAPPAAPPVAPPVAPAIPEVSAPAPVAEPPSVPASVPVASEVRKASPVVAQDEDEEPDLDVDEDEPAAISTDNSEDEVQALLSHRAPVGVESESTALVPVPPKGRLTRKSKGNSKAVVQRVSGRQLRRTTIYFDVELARTLAIYCASTDREMSEVVSIAVKQFLKKNPL